MDSYHNSKKLIISYFISYIICFFIFLSLYIIYRNNILIILQLFCYAGIMKIFSIKFSELDWKFEYIKEEHENIFFHITQIMPFFMIFLSYISINLINFIT